MTAPAADLPVTTLMARQGCSLLEFLKSEAGWYNGWYNGHFSRHKEKRLTAL